MNDIFGNACFGKVYKTRDGRKAILTQHFGRYVVLQVEDKNDKNHSSEFDYYLDGKPFYREYNDISGLDIISVWKPEINEDELDELADKYSDEAPMTEEFPDGYNTPCLYHRCIQSRFS